MAMADKPLFTLAPLRRMIKRHGASRVSDDAALELAKHLEELTKALAIESRNIAKHAGRSTILRSDVKLAKRIVKE